MLSLIQDGFSEEQWKEAEEAVASVKVREVYLSFNVKSTKTCEAVESITTCLSSNKFIEEITLRGVPEEMRAAVEDKLHSSRVIVHVY